MNKATKSQVQRILDALLDRQKLHYPELAYEVLQALETTPFAMPWEIDTTWQEAAPGLSRRWLRRDRTGVQVAILQEPSEDHPQWTYNMWDPSPETGLASAPTVLHPGGPASRPLLDTLAYVDAVLTQQGWHCLGGSEPPPGEATEATEAGGRAGPWTVSQGDADWQVRYVLGNNDNQMAAQVRPAQGKPNTYTWYALGHTGQETHPHKDVALSNAKTKADNRLIASGYTLRD